ncbi:hypothetical protein Bbelb_298180 [Branchiostoma belcheri]|nr:hypothetical protein Bbelb_298180 [Branchiostoma belcheri]
MERFRGTTLQATLNYQSWVKPNNASRGLSPCVAPPYPKSTCGELYTNNNTSYFAGVFPAARVTQFGVSLLIETEVFRAAGFVFLAADITVSSTTTLPFLTYSHQKVKAIIQQTTFKCMPKALCLFQSPVVFLAGVFVTTPGGLRVHGRPYLVNTHLFRCHTASTTEPKGYEGEWDNSRTTQVGRMSSFCGFFTSSSVPETSRDTEARARQLGRGEMT